MLTNSDLRIFLLQFFFARESINDEIDLLQVEEEEGDHFWAFLMGKLLAL